MLLAIPGVMAGAEVEEARRALAAAAWGDGRATSGYQSALVKRNQQLPDDHPVAAGLRRLVLGALARSQAFTAAVLPQRVFPPRFNRYADGGTFGDHIDNAILDTPQGPLRGDVSATLFLADPASYDGGELVIEDTYGSHRVKLPAGDLVVYPASSIHRAEPVTRGERLACFFWVQSLVRDDGQRVLLHDLDLAIGGLRRRGLGGERELVMLAGLYHNLLRRWSEP